MQKYFTKEISQSLKVIVLGLAIGLGVSFVSANWTPPIGSAPGCASGNPGCDAPINVSTNNQSKGNGIQNIGNTFNVYGTSSADQLWGFDGLTVGAPSTLIANDAAKLFSTLTINKSAYPDTSTDARGRNLIELVGSASSGDSVGIIQNKPWFFFWDYSNNGRAGIKAGDGDFEGSVKIFDGTQATNRVFASKDGSGNGAWADVTVSGGGLDLVTKKVDCPWGASSGNCAQTDWAGTAAGFLSMQARVWCDAGYVPIGGGGDCQHATAPSDPGFISLPIGQDSQAMSISSVSYNTSGSSANQPIGWVQTCPRGDAHVQVICAKTRPTTVSVNFPSSGVVDPGTPPVNPDAGWTIPGNSYFSSNNQSCNQALGNRQFRVKRTYNGVVTYLDNKVVRTNVTGGSAFLLIGEPNTVNGRCAGGGVINTSNNSDPFEGATVQLQYQ
jgi:hypothetical protein